MEVLWFRELVALVCLVAAAAIAVRLLYRRRLKSTWRWKRMGLDRPDVWVERVTARPEAPAAVLPAKPACSTVELRPPPIANLKQQVLAVRASLQQSLRTLEQLQEGYRSPGSRDQAQRTELR